MINAIKIAGLRNGELTQFLDDILALVRQNDPALLNVQDQYDALRALFLNIEELFKTPTGHIISAELEDLDSRRDNAFNGISSIITGHAYSTNATMKSNAALLANHLSIFGTGVAQDNYQSETATIRNILSDWDTKPSLTAAIAELGLKSWAEELADANNSFSQKYLVRASEMGTASTDSIRTLRLQAHEAYYQLRDHLNAHFTIHNGADPYGKTVSFINGLVDNYNSLLSRRSGSGEVSITEVAAAQIA